MGQNAASVDVDLITNCNVVTEDSHVLEARPLADGAVPSNNGLPDQGMVLDLGPLQDDTVLQPDTVANDNVRSNGDMGSDLAVVANLSRRVNQDVSVDIRLGGRGEQLGLLPLQRLEVQLGSSNEVLGLPNIHPEALKVKGVELAIQDHGREGLLLDGGRSQIDAVEDRRVENVDTGIDPVADELDGLLHEPLDTGLVARGVHNNTILRGLLDLGDTNSALISVLLVECGQLLKWVFARHVGVKDEERGVVLSEDFASQLKGTGSSQGLGLDREGNVDAESLGVLFTRTL